MRYKEKWSKLNGRCLQRCAVTWASQDHTYGFIPKFCTNFVGCKILCELLSYLTYLQCLRLTRVWKYFWCVFVQCLYDQELPTFTVVTLYQSSIDLLIIEWRIKRSIKLDLLLSKSTSILLITSLTNIIDSHTKETCERVSKRRICYFGTKLLKI